MSLDCPYAAEAFHKLVKHTTQDIRMGCRWGIAEDVTVRLATNPHRESKAREKLIEKLPLGSPTLLIEPNEITIFLWDHKNRDSTVLRMCRFLPSNKNPRFYSNAIRFSKPKLKKCMDVLGLVNWQQVEQDLVRQNAAIEAHETRRELAEPRHLTLVKSKEA